MIVFTVDKQDEDDLIKHTKNLEEVGHRYIDTSVSYYFYEHIDDTEVDKIVLNLEKTNIQHTVKRGY